MKFFTKASLTNSETQRERDNREIAFEAAIEGIVLLENHNPVIGR